MKYFFVMEILLIFAPYFGTNIHIYNNTPKKYGKKKKKNCTSVA